MNNVTVRPARGARSFSRALRRCVALSIILAALAGATQAAEIRAPSGLTEGTSQDARFAHLTLSRTRRLAQQSGAGVVEEVPGGETILPAPPDGSSHALRSDCGFWIISTRNMPCPKGCEFLPPDPEVWRFAGPCDATQVDAAEFLAAASSGQPLVIFVHGNRVEGEDAPTLGWKVYEKLCAACPPDCGFQFVLWTWPSDRIAGPVKDVRVKAHKCDCESYNLAWVIDRIDPDVPITLMGYSFGARLVNGALHVLGGGRLAGRQLVMRVHPERRPIRAVLLAAASDSTWLLPGQPHDRALSQVDRMFVLFNREDPVLRWYPLLEHGGEALGYSGVAAPWRLGPEGDKIEQIDVMPVVGREHGLAEYFAHHELIAQVRWLAIMPLKWARERRSLMSR